MKNTKIYDLGLFLRSWSVQWIMVYNELTGISSDFAMKISTSTSDVLYSEGEPCLKVFPISSWSGLPMAGDLHLAFNICLRVGLLVVKAISVVWTLSVLPQLRIQEGRWNLGKKLTHKTPLPLQTTHTWKWKWHVVEEEGRSPFLTQSCLHLERMFCSCNWESTGPSITVSDRLVLFCVAPLLGSNKHLVSFTLCKPHEAPLLLSNSHSQGWWCTHAVTNMLLIFPGESQDSRLTPYWLFCKGVLLFQEHFWSTDIFFSIRSLTNLIKTVSVFYAVTGLNFVWQLFWLCFSYPWKVFLCILVVSSFIVQAGRSFLSALCSRLLSLPHFAKNLFVGKYLNCLLIWDLLVVLVFPFDFKNN